MNQLKKKFEEGRPQQNSKVNRFEAEMRRLADIHKSDYRFEVVDGTVSDNQKRVTRADHLRAKLSKGDLMLCFEEMDFVLSLKLSERNSNKKLIPRRVVKALGKHYLHIESKQDQYFILDTNEVKELRNGRGRKYLAYHDENFGGYYLYCMNDLQSHQASPVFLEPEGGVINLVDRYNVETFHPLMSKEEGEVKRKHLIHRTVLKFETALELFQFFLHHLVLPVVRLEQKRNSRMDKLEEYQSYKTSLLEFLRTEKVRFTLENVLGRDRLIVKHSKNVLIKVHDIVKDVYNDEILHEYDLFAYDTFVIYHLMKKERPNLTVAEFYNTYIDEVVKKKIEEEVEHMRHTYRYNAQRADQTHIPIVAPSSFFDKKEQKWKGKCAGATRKEAITCKMELL